MLTCATYTSNHWQIFRISCAKTFENKLQKIVCILFGINSVIAISNVVAGINSTYSENIMQKSDARFHWIPILSSKNGARFD